MSPLRQIFRADSKLTDILAAQRFTLSAEVIPPRNGAQQASVFSQIQALTENGAQFLAVTKGAGGSLRGGSLPIAQAVKERFNAPCIAHFTCRDLTPHDVENQLMDHHYFGIRNILALRGDPPDGNSTWNPREGSYQYAYQLIEQIRSLNEGRYLDRQGGPSSDSQTQTDFCIGAAVYPEHPHEGERLKFFKLKVQAGAEYAITQMLFDPDAYARFMDLCAKNGIAVPVLPGTRLLKTQAQALRVAKKFEVSIPQALLNELDSEETPDSVARSVERFLRMTERFKQLGAPGIHLFVLSDTAGASLALKQLRELADG